MSLEEIERSYDVLKDVPLFFYLDKKSLWKLAGLVQIKQFHKGEILIEQNSDSSGLFIVLEGTLRVSMGFDSDVKEISQIGKGGIVGEISVIDEKPAIARVTALTECQCAYIEAWEFREQMHAYPTIALQLLPIFTERIRFYSEKFSNFPLEE